jgi:Second Messenger Oligonucleotide or Dinucleotide Synthetase domain
MATTINAGFVQLAAILEITALQSTTTSTRQQNVRDAVARGLTVIDSFLAGSYARSTMIGPLKDADIDIMVVLDSVYFNQFTPAALLQKVRAVLLQTYSTTPKISPNGQAVTITFTDFTVDVVPAFHRQGGGYLIPDSSAGVWISTDPTTHATVLTAQNTVHAGDLVPLVKMIKGWNRIIGSPFVGFYLELMTVDILTNVNINDFSSGVRFVLDRGREKIKLKQIDPAGFGGQVNGLMAGTVDEAVARFTAAYNRAVSAEALAAVGRIPDATDEWRRIFDHYFPTYG